MLARGRPMRAPVPRARSRNSQAAVSSRTSVPSCSSQSTPPVRGRWRVWARVGDHDLVGAWRSRRARLAPAPVRRRSPRLRAAFWGPWPDGDQEAAGGQQAERAADQECVREGIVDPHDERLIDPAPQALVLGAVIRATMSSPAWSSPLRSAVRGPMPARSVPAVQRLRSTGDTPTTC